MPSPQALKELETLYSEVDREVEATGVTCWVRGLCCDFEKVDHVLYASSLELTGVREAHPGDFEPGSKLCPFWKEGLCTLREGRPLGCRTYFCDENFREPLEALYEKYHARLKEISVRHGLAWSYEPFVLALRGGGEKNKIS